MVESPGRSRCGFFCRYRSLDNRGGRSRLSFRYHSAHLSVVIGIEFERGRCHEFGSRVRIVDFRDEALVDVVVVSESDRFQGDLRMVAGIE